MTPTNEPEFCLITTCMSRLAQLQQSLGPAASQANATCVVVDYSCPNRCGDWVRSTHPNVQVVSVPNRTRFSVTEARNAGAAVAKSPWLIFFDADVILQPGFTDAIHELIKPGRYYRPTPMIDELSGTVVCERKHFAAIGGYDEVIHGYGGDDYDLYDRLKYIGLTEHTFPASIVQPIHHSHELRTENYDIKERWHSDFINRLYMVVKMDLTRITGQNLPEDDRRKIYRQVMACIKNFLTKPGPAKLDVNFRRLSMPKMGMMETVLTYILTPNMLVEARQKHAATGTANGGR